MCMDVLVNFICGLIQCSSLENICHFLNYHNSLRFGDSSETKLNIMLIEKGSYRNWKNIAGRVNIYYEKGKPGLD